jgi:hypothetical protein
VRYAVSKKSNTQITLTDLSAKNMYTTAFRADTEGEQTAIIPVSHIPAGIYLISVVSGNKAETQKVVITK